MGKTVDGLSENDYLDMYTTYDDKKEKRKYTHFTIQECEAIRQLFLSEKTYQEITDIVTLQPYEVDLG